MTNEVIRAVVITGKYAVQSSPREKRNNQGTEVMDQEQRYAQAQDRGSGVA